MTVVEAPKAASGGPQGYPLSVNACHALGELGLVPEKTELSYSQFYRKIAKSPFHTYFLQFLLEL